MPWLISYQYREAYKGYVGLTFGPPKDDITVSDLHPAAYVGNCASDVLSLKAEIERDPETEMRMRRVTRIHFAMEVPEDVAALECLTDMESDELDPDEEG